MVTWLTFRDGRSRPARPTVRRRPTPKRSPRNVRRRRRADSAAERTRPELPHPDSRRRRVRPQDRQRDGAAGDPRLSERGARSPGGPDDRGCRCPGCCRSATGDAIVRGRHHAGASTWCGCSRGCRDGARRHAAAHRGAARQPRRGAWGRRTARSRGSTHPAMRRPFPWDLARTPWIAAETRTGSRTRTAGAHRARARGEVRGPVAPRLARLRQQVIHNDWNDYNVLVAPGRSAAREVVGVVDFGDMVWSPVVADLAVALHLRDARQARPARRRGGHRPRVPRARCRSPTTSARCCSILIRARLAISVTMAACQSAAAPGNDYLRISQEQAWPLLERARRRGRRRGRSPCSATPAGCRRARTSRRDHGLAVGAHRDVRPGDGARPPQRARSSCST